MAMVFVHGVNTRKGPGYDAQVAVTSNFLAHYLKGAVINGKTVGNSPPIAFPYWGDLGISFAWEMASLPRGDLQALGGASKPGLRAIAATLKDGARGALGDEPLTTMAKQDFPLTVEVLTSLLLEDPPRGKETEIADFVVAAQAYALANASPSWLGTVTTDAQLIGNLKLAIAQHSPIQAQGLGSMINAVMLAAQHLKNSLKGLAGKAADQAGDFASSKLLGWAREPLNENLGRFFGDVFVYFEGRGDKDSPGEIPSRILQAIDAAASAAAAGNEPLLIICHSLGGVITYDLLSHYRSQLEVDLFVSAGSQIAHFEEIKLYHSSDKTIKLGKKAPTPANIRHWINVFDVVDIFSYACKDVFDRVDVDAEYDTRTYVVKSHSEYFKQARFYERLRARIDAL